MNAPLPNGAVVSDPRTRFALAISRAATAGAEALLALVDYATARGATASTDDPLWGRVDADHLPAWISREQFTDACALKLIDGATKVGRRWVAPRHAVETWALSGAKTAANDSDDELLRRTLADRGGRR